MRAAVRLACRGAVMVAFGVTAALAVALNRPAPVPAALTTDTRPHPVPVCTAMALTISLADGAGSPAGPGGSGGAGASGGTGVSGGAGLARGTGLSAGATGGPVIRGVSAYPVDFTNTSRRACTLRGYPSVAAYDARPDGYRQVGNLAVDASLTVGRVLLRPGGTAHSDVDISPVVPGAACRPVAVTGLRIVPPGASRPQYLRVRLITCSATGPRTRACLHVRPVQAGAGIAPAQGAAHGVRHDSGGTPANPE